MKNKGVLILVLCLFLAVISLAAVYAAENSTEDKAYSCLENKVNDKCSSLSLEEQAFSLLALGYNSAIQSECRNSINSLSSNSECWPKDSCKIKDTALILLAFKNIQQNTDKPENWILSHNITSNDVEWYLEIDSSGNTECTISHDSVSKKITINEDKKISSISDSCLSLAYNNYWLKIAASCLRKKFTISCNQNFISTLLYKKPSSNTWYVTSDVQSASAGASTEHELNYYCFSTSSSCNYEDNLWAGLALQKSGYNIKGVLPYLNALAEDNEKLFPESFLYTLTSSDENLKKITDLQNTEGFWNIDNKKFYSTAEALLALSSQSSSDVFGNAKAWLQDNQGTDGCWNGIRDTAFLLWAGYYKQSSITGTDEFDCETDGDGYCITQTECDEVSGNTLDSYFCHTSGIKVCCDKPKKEKTCQEQAGIECPSGKVCDEATVSSSDKDKCCLGNCIAESTESACEKAGDNCRASCLSSEEEADYSCSGTQICCTPSTDSKSYWWLWLLIILIILVVLAIIFRNRLRVLIFKFKGGASTGNVSKTRPGYFPPSSGMRKPTGFISRAVSATDRELEDTLKKLKDMSK